MTNCFLISMRFFRLIPMSLCNFRLIRKLRTVCPNIVSEYRFFHANLKIPFEMKPNPTKKFSTEPTLVPKTTK